MASDSDSAEDIPFTDCATSGTDRGPTKRRKRQVSVTEMVRRAEGRKAKRQAQSRGSPSPGKASATSPEATHLSAGPAEGVELNAASLTAIQQLIEASTARVIQTYEAKCEQFEKRIEILESEGMDREVEMKGLRERLESQIKVNSELQQQVESIDANRRLSSLILTCSEFETRQPNEDIERRVVDLLNRRFGDVRLTIADIQVAHRLQTDSKVIVKFVKRRVRDDLYDRRFELARRDAGAGSGPPGGAARGQPRPLYINESLSPANRAIYNELLDARKPSNGTRVASVFSRRGVVFCRRVRGGANIMVPDLPSLRRILGGGGGSSAAPRPVPQRPSPRGGPAPLAAPTAKSSAASTGGGPGPRPTGGAAASSAGAAATSALLTSAASASGPGGSSGEAAAGLLLPVSGGGPVRVAAAAPAARAETSRSAGSRDPPEQMNCGDGAQV